MFNLHRTFQLTTGVKGKTIAVIHTNKELFVLYHETVVFHLNTKTLRCTIANGGYDTISTRFVINRAFSQCLHFQSYYLERKSKTTYLKSCYLEAPIEFKSGETITVKGKLGHL